MTLWSLKSSSMRCVLIPPVRCTHCLGHSMWGFACRRLTWAYGSQAPCRCDAGRGAPRLRAVLVALQTPPKKAREGNATMNIKKIYANDNGQSTLVCEKCGKTRVINIADFKDISKLLKVKCTCGHVFFASIEVRKFYR